MASIKNLKSKGRTSVLLDPTPVEYGFYSDTYRHIDPAATTLYQYRKAAFASLPPAKTVRPLRVLRARYQQALSLWERGIAKDGHTIYPYAAEATYRTGRFCAGVGKGHLLQRLVA